MISNEPLEVVKIDQCIFGLKDEKSGMVAGMAIVHIDDLLWTVGKEIKKNMEKACSLYKFGKIEKYNFTYCGRQITKDEQGIHVTCPSLIDRVKPIFFSTEQRKNKEGAVSEEARGQLKSVIGSLAWLGRVCRPESRSCIPFGFKDAVRCSQGRFWRCYVCQCGGQHCTKIKEFWYNLSIEALCV